MSRLRKIFTNTRVIILLVCLLLGIAMIYPDPWNEGVAIKAVSRNSSAEAAGIENPKARLSPMQNEIIIRINNKPVANVQDYFSIVNSLRPNQSVSVKTDKRSYTLIARPRFNITELNETELVVVNETVEVNETINETAQLVNKTVEREISRPKVLRELVGVEPLGISVSDAPKSNLRKGLDLQGGTRVILSLEKGVTDEQMQDAIDTLQQRLNVYGLSDVVIAPVSGGISLLGESDKFILIEIAGVSEEEVRSLIATQGKFEAQVGNATVFSGGNDITYVCRTAQCSGIDPDRPCQQFNGVWSCGFSFSMTISPSAADRFADATRNIPVSGESLSEQIVFYLDDQEVQRLNIAASLKGRAATDISISGGEEGATEGAARENTLKEMRRLQTIIKTGSLPVKLSLERIDTISPNLGKQFLSNALLMGIISLVAVAIVLISVYRRLSIAVPIIFTALSEIFLTLAIASLISWNIDLAAIAGIILAVGTGVNDQIVITDEALRKESAALYNWKERIKRAFFIIMSAYFTVVVAMVPLLFAGAGLLKGFAITTILAVSVGVFITRPAYAAIVQMLVEE